MFIIGAYNSSRNFDVYNHSDKHLISAVELYNTSASYVNVQGELSNDNTYAHTSMYVILQLVGIFFIIGCSVCVVKILTNMIIRKTFGNHVPY